MVNQVRVVLLANYAPDRQWSMLRFARSLASGLSEQGHVVSTWAPPVLAGRISRDHRRGLGKWLGYVDKFVIFPLLLFVRARTSRRDTVFHVCDHSNAIWLWVLPSERTLITCHDVLAIRGARGHAETYCPASLSGRILQRLILAPLLRARRVACVSEFTRSQLAVLAHEAGGDSSAAQDRFVVPNMVDRSLVLHDEARLRALMGALDVPARRPFLLHVGSGHGRKNRALLVEMLDHLVGEERAGQPGARPGLLLVMAGAPLDEELAKSVADRGLERSVVSVERPSDDILTALYQSCSVFVFPSFAEGFGWPLIEAQACGAPVVASLHEPMPEVCGDGAVLADPHRPDDFARAVEEAMRPDRRSALVAAGAENIRRFDPEPIIAQYVAAYRGITVPTR